VNRAQLHQDPCHTPVSSTPTLWASLSRRRTPPILSARLWDVLTRFGVVEALP